jgi:hypothetical protein
MVTMIDEIFDRAYQSRRGELNSALGLLFSHAGKTVADAFRALNRIEYSAPWLERRHSRR